MATSRKNRLDRAAVVEAAARLSDAAGGREITLAELAAHLGVRIPSLYNHIAGGDGLRRELALLGLRDLAARLARAGIGKAGDDAVLALAEAYRAFARERPGLYNATLRAPDATDPVLGAAAEEVVSVVRAVVAAYGLSDEATIHTIRGFRSLLHGFVALELLGGFGLPYSLDESFRRLVRLFTAGLSSLDSPAPPQPSGGGTKPR